MHPLQAADIYGNWATLLLPVEKDESIHYGKLSEEIDQLISMGVSGIYSNGTAGEFYNQTEAEFDAISLLLAEKCEKAGMPFQIGCSHPCPITSIERVRRVRALQPGGIQVILPDWSEPSMREVISFLRRIIDEAGEIAVVLYNPPHAKRRLQPVDYGRLREAGVQLTGCKTGGGDANWYVEMKLHAPELSVFVPGHHLATGISMGAHGAYSNMACLHPGAAQQWYKIMLSDMPKALEWQSRIHQFMNSSILPYILQKEYSGQAVDKLLAAIGNWAPISTRLRWPYDSIDMDDVISLREKCRQLLPEFFPTT